ncbi:MAG: ribosome biogenesis GTP-binding protein YihA/YsxC [Pseudomonadota bacterium]
MKTLEAKFLKSVFDPAQLPKTDFPEIAFSGRSNVGKSTLINSLLNRKGLAKTSSTPGRTQSINFIEINRAYYFVDLPGYGYAKVPEAVKIKWRYLIEEYFKNRAPLRLVVLIIDSRRDPVDAEAQFAEWLQSYDIPILFVLTKIDKITGNMRQKSLGAWQKFLCTDVILPFSAITGEGKDKLWKVIHQYLHNKS